MSQSQIQHDCSDIADIQAVVSTFIETELMGGASNVPVQIDDDLLTSGIVDSLGVMRLVTFIETRFQISVKPEEVTIEHFMTVDAISRFVRARLT